MDVRSNVAAYDRMLAARSRLNAQDTEADAKSGPDGRGQLFGRLQVLSVDDIDTAPPRTYLLKGVMSLNETSLWVGAPKCGKSFLLLSIAYKLALGLRVFGHRVKACKVLYVAAEGEGGIAKRLKALRAKYGPAQNFHYVAQPVDLMRDDGHKQEIIDTATKLGSELIVIDTLARALAGGDENSPDDMGTFILNVSYIREHTNAHVAIVHHGTKASDGRSPRGHGSLAGAVDALVEVQKQADGSCLATHIFSKDDAIGVEWGFRLDVVELGLDEDGDPLTTLVVEELVEAPPRATEPQKLSKTETVALQCLKREMVAHARLVLTGDENVERSVVTDHDWRIRFYREAMPDDDQGTKQKAFRRAFIGLQSKELIFVQNGFVWRPDI